MSGCSGETPPLWSGTTDTLPNGTIIVSNPEIGVWGSTPAWQISELARIGALDSEGPDLFGRITAIELDRQDRMWVFDGQAQELRVFTADGRHVRTIGRKGGGPGEFNQVIGMVWDPEGRLWLVDPQNNRISVVDTAGTFVTSHRMLGGFVFMPWPGGFDRDGYFWNYTPDMAGGTFGGMLLVRYDADDLTPVDTVTPPRWQGPENFFEMVSADGSSRMRSSVPFSPGLQWRLTYDGDFWFVHTGTYELFRRSASGDTTLKVTKPFTPMPVTAADRERALAGLEWFTRQGGRVDASRIPGTRPPVSAMLLSDDGHVLIMRPRPTTPDTTDTLLEVFDSGGRYLGELHVPFRLSTSPRPVIRGGRMLAVTTDDLGVQYVVRARIEGYEEPPAFRDRASRD